MASVVNPDEPRSPDYRGLDSIFEYINQDGTHQDTNCGQAAAATYLTWRGKIPPGAADTMAAIEEPYPPDNLGGYFGTSRRQVERICRHYDVPLGEVDGEDELRAEIARGQPVIVMLGVSAGKFWGIDLPGGHWMVAYGYDEENVYLTNQGKMTWAEFRAGWGALVPRLIQMRNRGLAARDEA